MMANPEVTANELAISLSITKRTVERDIAWLSEKQIINRQGSDKNGKWVVLKSLRDKF